MQIRLRAQHERMFDNIFVYRGSPNMQAKNASAHRCNDGTGSRGIGMLTFAQKLGEYPLHPSEGGDLLANALQSIRSNFLDRDPAAAAFKAQKFAYFIEAKTQSLGALDEAHPIYHCRGVAAHTTVARRNRQQAAALVVSNRLDPHPGGSRETPDREERKRVRRTRPASA